MRFSGVRIEQERRDAMKMNSFRALSAGVILLLLFFSFGIGLREGNARTAPPISPPLVREGAFAVDLAVALNLGQPSSEAEAESMLGEVGIAPRNGWIADYPLT